MKKGFLDISFSWIFALIIGVVILVGAFYFVNQFGETKNTQSSAEYGTKLFNLLIPLETGIEQGKSVRISFPIKTRINHMCEIEGEYGNDEILIQEFMRNKWTESGVKVSSEGSYLFFPELIEGREFFSFSNSFEFPFKIANLIYIVNAQEVYCFSDTPRSIKEELENFNNPNFKFENCNAGESVTKVCFNPGSGCDIEINLNRKEVKKNSTIVYFEGNPLMYAGIFSDKEIYECQIKRLMKRGVDLTNIYRQKSLNLRSVGCESDLTGQFSTLQNSFSTLQNSGDLVNLEIVTKDITSINKFSRCTLW